MQQDQITSVSPNSTNAIVGSSFKLGDILSVKTPNGRTFFERVIEIKPEVLTESMSIDPFADISTQGLTENFSYKKVDNYILAMLLDFYNQGRFSSVSGSFFSHGYKYIIRNGMIVKIEDCNE